MKHCSDVGRPTGRRRAGPAAALLAAVGWTAWTLASAGCQRPPDPPPKPSHPFLVVGIDGAEWRVIRQLWTQGRLPHFKMLAAAGVSAHLTTRYTSSPVIWTTIATGVRPKVHGVVDFVVPTPNGDVPVSSSVRRVPAIWNMLSKAGRRVAVLGWWASWPAEEVRGLVVSDRALLDVERRVSPPDYLPDFLAEVEAARQDENLFRGNEATRDRDHVMARLGRRLATQGYDLVLTYFRGVDIVSHTHWKYYEPEAFGSDRALEAAAIAEHREAIPREYEAVDAALGGILEAAAGTANVMVISDHGFHAAEPEIVKVGLDFDDVLERLGYLARGADGVDLERSQLMTFASHEFRAVKWLRFTTSTAADRRSQIRHRFEHDMGRISYDQGGAAFQVREPTRRERRRDVDLVVEVLTGDAGKRLLLDGDPRPLDGLITHVSRVSGTHGEHTDGIFLAAGPDIDPGAEVEGISIHDVTPTLLYGLGLPVAEDFAGRPWVELFRPEFQRRYPVRTIASWGAAREGLAVSSEKDDELVRELRALGYLD